MIIARSPLRISFVGGGTDLPDFYRHYPGRVISATIDKCIYIAINQAHLLDNFLIKYQMTEIVKHPSQLKHTRFRAALLEHGIFDKGMEIASFADLPSNTGLGSSSSFTVALTKGLRAYLGKPISQAEVAEAACRLEIDILGEPIGKQDQYAAAYGGLNIYQFNADGSVDVEPVLMDFKKKALLEDHIFLFFTGITRSASSVLTEQKSNIADKLELYQKMSDSVYDFRDRLLAGDIPGLAAMLHEAWLRKKSLASNVSNPAIDALYEAGLVNGAMGGKILGAGAGGCLLLLAPPDKHEVLGAALNEAAYKAGLFDYKQIPVKFTQAGADVLFHSQGHHH